MSTPIHPLTHSLARAVITHLRKRRWCLVRKVREHIICLAPGLATRTSTVTCRAFGRRGRRSAAEKLKDVEEAQQYIVGVAKELEARGEITIATGMEEDELIY